MATQNPIEQEGTYHLPEAQLDRFLFNIMVKYPSKREELDIMRNVTGDTQPELKEVVDAKTIVEFQKLVRRIPVADHIFEYAAALVRSTRPDEPDSPDFVKKLMSWGAGPRASLNLILAGKARAALRGRTHVSIDDIQKVCLPILRHRVTPKLLRTVGGDDSDSLIGKLLEEIPANEDLYREKSRLSRLNVGKCTGNYIPDPEILQRLGDLELIAREVVEGLRVGSHRSPLRGFSTEFAHHRQYVPGDSARSIDWRVYGRSDRYYTKLYEAETNFDCHLLIDSSSSMTYGSGKVNKLEYAKFLELP